MESKNIVNPKVSNFSNLRTPIHGSVDHKPVRVIAYADVEGNSPSYLCVNGEGQSRWVSLAQVTIIDTNFLPLSTDALSTLQAAESRR